jgi:cytochrome c peroxidase
MGRAKTLEGQVTAAWKAQIGADPVRAAAVIAAVPAYQAEFQAAFGVAPNAENTAQALAAFLRTLNSGESPWDRYTAGDRTAVSADAVAGYELFNGKAGCAGCHKPPLFSDGQFHNIGLEAGKANPGPRPLCRDQGPARQVGIQDAVAAFGRRFPAPISTTAASPAWSSRRALHGFGRQGGSEQEWRCWWIASLPTREIATTASPFLHTLTSHERFEPPKLP